MTSGLSDALEWRLRFGLLRVNYPGSGRAWVRVEDGDVRVPAGISSVSTSPKMRNGCFGPVSISNASCLLDTGR